MPSSDWIVRGLLAGILCALVALVALLWSGPAPSRAASPGRYLVSVPQDGSEHLIRIDSLTGRSWKLDLAEGQARWEPFGESETVAAAAARRGTLAARGLAAGRGPTGSARPNPRRALAPEVGRALLNRELPSDIRVWAAYQLAEVPGALAAGFLIQVLDDPESQVVHAALEALASHSGPRVRAALENMRAHPDPHVSRRVGELLRERG